MNFLKRTPFRPSSSNWIQSHSLPSVVIHSLRKKHTLPDLPYAYNALEPVISGRIMELHHQGHHQSYVTQLNEFEEKYKVATEKKDLLTQLTLQPGLKFHAGGHVNHSLFWPSLCPVKEYTPPSPSFLKVLEHEFQSYDTFVKEFSSMLTRLQGSGWGWLCKHPSHPHHLHITWTANQDPVFPTQGYIPLLGIDVWEHAYYLDYLNQKGKYVNEIWKIINWKEVEKRYHEVTPSKV